jgi:nucleoside-diphosphate-sugar epimerase
MVDAGHDLVCAVRNPDAYAAPAGAAVLDLDLASPLPDTLPEVDAVVHLAQANVRFPDGATELFRVNTAATQELLDHARRVGAERFVYASTGSVYGFGDRPFNETDPVVQHDFYAVTKIAGEHLVGAYGEYLNTVVLRLFAPYGPGQNGRLIPGVIGRVREGRPVTLNDGGRPRMNPLYVDDVVRAFTGALELEGHHVLNVAGDEVVGIGDLAELAAQAVGRSPVLEDGTNAASGDLIGDTTRLHQVLDLRPLVSLEDGVRQTAQEGT